MNAGLLGYNVDEMKATLSALKRLNISPEN